MTLLETVENKTKRQIQTIVKKYTNEGLKISDDVLTTKLLNSSGGTFFLYKNGDLIVAVEEEIKEPTVNPVGPKPVEPEIKEVIVEKVVEKVVEKPVMVEKEVTKTSWLERGICAVIGAAVASVIWYISVFGVAA